MHETLAFPEIENYFQSQVMPRRRLSLLVPALVPVALGLLAGHADADRRSFTHTYEYATVPEGQTALELWHTEERQSWDATSPQRFEQILEIEHGLTERWDAALYTTFAQTAGDATTSEALHLQDVRLETRYRFADRGEWPVDTLVYLELSKDFGHSLYEIEGKVVGARDFDRVTVAANLIGEIQLGRNAAESEPELAWAAGATYELDPKVRLGAETWGNLEEGATSAYVGPVLALAPPGKLWLTFTAGFGLTDAAAAFTGRAILGIDL